MIMRMIMIDGVNYCSKARKETNPNPNPNDKQAQLFTLYYKQSTSLPLLHLFPRTSIIWLSLHRNISLLLTSFAYLSLHVASPFAPSLSTLLPCGWVGLCLFSSRGYKSVGGVILTKNPQLLAALLGDRLPLLRLPVPLLLPRLSVLLLRPPAFCWVRARETPSVLCGELSVVPSARGMSGPFTSMNSCHSASFSSYYDEELMMLTMCYGRYRAGQSRSMC